MTMLQIIGLLFNLSIALVVLGLGLQASLRDAAYLFRHPGLLVRSILSMNIAMPVFATLLVLLFDLHPAIKVAIVALALSPVPPFLPRSQTKAGGLEAYVVSLLVITAVLSLIIVPLGSNILEQVFNIDSTIPVDKIAVSLGLTVALPLAAGMLVHDLFGSLAARLARPVSLGGLVLLVAVCIPVLFFEWGAIWSMIGNGTLVVLTIFAIVGVTVGHFLGGPIPENRVVLALATASRHPGVALIVAGSYLPHIGPALSVVLWHLIVGAVISGAYSRWMHLLPQPAAAKPSGKLPIKPPIKPHSPPIR
jgi:BASS family bile acid:Na+ symporter